MSDASCAASTISRQGLTPAHSIPAGPPGLKAPQVGLKQDTHSCKLLFRRVVEVTDSVLGVQSDVAAYCTLLQHDR